MGVLLMCTSILAHEVQAAHLANDDTKTQDSGFPQTPKPPFPYDVEDVTYTNAKDGNTIAGTLNTPRGDKPYPVVIMITGSGAQDRDETIFGHKPFAVIADHLARNGIATLRTDDRGVGGSTGNIARSTSFDFAGDVLAGVEFLKSKPDINMSCIGLIGHSEGGLIAPMVAAESDDIAFIILLAGPGLPGIDILGAQLELILLTAGVKKEIVAQQLIAQQELHRGVIDGADDETLKGSALKLIRLQIGLPVESDKPLSKYETQTTARVLAQVKSPWMKAFIEYDPRPTLHKVKCPVLALNGELDLQVPYEANLDAIKTALIKADNADITTQSLPKLNHLFQTAKTGMIGEYATIEETFAPHVLDILSNWIQQRSNIKSNVATTP